MVDVNAFAFRNIVVVFLFGYPETCSLEYRFIFFLSLLVKVCMCTNGEQAILFQRMNKTFKSYIP